MITRRGIGFVVIAVSVFFVASATRVGWLHVADALLWGVIAMSAALPWLTVPRLRITRRIHTPRRRGGEVAPIVGDTVDVELEIANPTRWPRFFVSAHQPSSTGNSSESRQRFFFAGIPARGSARATSQIECDRRGWRDFQPVVIESRLPFGLFRRRRHAGDPGRVLVYPMWHNLERLDLIGPAMGEAASRRRARRGDEVAGSRRYVAGDSVRDIHWKNTARTGRASVKQYDAGAEQSIVIAFDAGVVYGEGAETTLEYAATLAASVARSIIRRGGAVRLGVDGRLSEPTFDWASVMHRLALVEPDYDGSLPAALRAVQPGERAFAAVSGRDQAGILALASLARRGAAVAAVILEGFTPADEAAAFLRSLESAGVRAITCRKGGIEEAIAHLDTGAASQRRVTSAPTLPGRQPAADYPAIRDIAA